MAYFTAFLIFLINSSPAFSDAAPANSCISCHASKSNPGYVDPSAYSKSVHGKFLCTNCHMDVVGYPHKHVSKVRCEICHFTGNFGAPTEQPLRYKLSVHGKAARAGNPAAPLCQTCHGSHDILPVKDPRSRVSRENIPALCSRCHPGEFRAYSGSIHGKDLLEKKNPAAATCFDCHMEHGIPVVKEAAWKLALIRQCGSCHPAEMNTYDRTFHGKVTELGYTTVAKCADCHGSHGILPPSDKNSALSKDHITATCAACHPGATPGFTKFYAHGEEKNRSRYPLLFYAYVFMTALLIAVFSFFFLHTSLWAYRSLRERMGDRKGGR